MSPRLAEQIALERTELHRLMSHFRPLVEECKSRDPDVFEIPALAKFLESYYSVFEEIFKRIAVEVGDGLPSGSAWHQQLLQGMVHRTERRPAVISATLAQNMLGYLRFRHVSRSVYSHVITWERMRDLISGCEHLAQAFDQELDEWIDQMR